MLRLPSARAQLRFQRCHRSQCNGAFRPKYLLAGLGQQGIHQEGWAARQDGSWPANQGIGILAQVVFPPIMRMN